MLELSDVLGELALLVGGLLLHELQVLFEALLLIAQFLLVVLNRVIVALLRPLPLLGEPALVSLLLDLVEALQLAKLLLRLPLHFTQLLLEVPGLVVELALQLQEPTCRSVLALFKHTRPQGVRDLCLI